MNNSELNPNNHGLQEDPTMVADQSIDKVNELDQSESTSQLGSEFLDSKINEIIQPDVDEEIVFPTYNLFRNLNHEIEVLKYQPGDLITLVLKNTGTSKSTTVEMFDSRDQSRYMGRSGGHDHEWTTRLQRTTILGNWRFTAQGPFIDESNLFSIDIPFEIVDHIPKEIPEEISTAEEVVLAEEGYEELIQFAISEKVNIPVIEIKGVGPSYQRRMNEVQVFYFHEILQSDPVFLSEQISINHIKIEMWVAFVAKVLQSKDHQLVLQYSPLGDDVGKGNELPSTIKGIGPVSEKKLLAAGFKNVLSIAESSVEELVKAIQITSNKGRTWIDSAKSLVTGVTEITIPVPQSEIAVKPTDLPHKITGVGPVTSKKLVGFGFKSISDIANADITDLVEVLKSEKRAKKVHAGAKLLLSIL